MEIKNVRFNQDIKSCFFDGSEKSAKFIVDNFNDFQYLMWTEQIWSPKLTTIKAKRLVYFCTDGDYQNIVPSNVYIIQFKMANSGHLTYVDWFTQEEFDKNFN